MGLAGAAADGVYSALNIKDPLNPDWDDDPAMREYLDAWDRTGEEPET